MSKKTSFNGPVQAIAGDADGTVYFWQCAGAAKPGESVTESSCNGARTTAAINQPPFLPRPPPFKHACIYLHHSKLQTAYSRWPT